MSNRRHWFKRMTKLGRKGSRELKSLFSTINYETKIAKQMSNNRGRALILSAWIWRFFLGMWGLIDREKRLRISDLIEVRCNFLAFFFLLALVIWSASPWFSVGLVSFLFCSFSKRGCGFLLLNRKRMCQ